MFFLEVCRAFILSLTVYCRACLLLSFYSLLRLRALLFTVSWYGLCHRKSKIAVAEGTDCFGMNARAVELELGENVEILYCDFDNPLFYTPYLIAGTALDTLIRS